MNNLESYAETNSLLWRLRIACNEENNQIGHDFICRVQRRLDNAVKIELGFPDVRP